MKLKQFLFDTKLVREISAALEELESKEGNLALITVSTHHKIYSAGIDFKMFDQNYQGAYGFVCEFSRLLGNANNQRPIHASGIPHNCSNGRPLSCWGLYVRHGP